MSLRNKIALVLFVAVSLFIGGDFVLSQLTFEERVFEYDSDRARERVGRVLTTLETKFEELDGSARDYRERMGDPKSWTRDMELPRTLPSAPLHVVLAYDDEGWLKVHDVRDPHSGEPTLLRELPNQRLSVSEKHPLVNWDEATGSHGLWVTRLGALLVSMHGVEDSDPPLRFAVGRFLDKPFMEGLKRASGVDVEVVLTQGVMLSDEQQEVLALTARSNEPVVREVDGRLVAWAAIPDLRDNSALLVRADSPDDLSEMWRAMSRDSLVSTLAVALLFPLVILLLLQWIVTGPLSRLTSHVVGIGHSNETDVRLDLQRTDEIGQLADEFDSMLGKLARSRQEVVQNARLAGMSEVSSGVLHNVGNVLNSVSVSANIAQSQLRVLMSSDLKAVSSELEGHNNDLESYLLNDERGRHLITFLGALVRQYDEQARDAGRELTELSEGIAHMAALISSLTSYDSRIGVIERIEVAAQVDAAIELCQRAQEDGSRVEIVRDFESLPSFELDRHKLMEILVNLVLNAQHAMAAIENPVLTVRVARRDDETVCIEISDNGVGIDRGELTRVFAQGYTTRPDARGLGLHLSGTAAGEIGATLTADSDGRGCGATFTLCLPLRVESPSDEPAEPTVVI